MYYGLIKSGSKKLDKSKNLHQDNSNQSSNKSQSVANINTVTYEAESSANTFYYSEVSYESPFSGGACVRIIGYGRTLQFNNVAVNTLGTYNMTISYRCGDRYAYYMGSDGIKRLIYFPTLANWYDIGTVTIPIVLKANYNTIKIGNDNGWAPDIDKIDLNLVSSSFSDVDSDGIYDFMETQGIPIGYNGRYITNVNTNASLKDSDGDGMDDGVELLRLRYFSFDSSTNKYFYEVMDNPTSNIRGSIAKSVGINPDYSTLFGATETMGVNEYKANILLCNTYISDFAVLRDKVNNYVNSIIDSEFVDQANIYSDHIDLCIDSFAHSGQYFSDKLNEMNDSSLTAWVSQNGSYFGNSGVTVASIGGNVYTNSISDAVFGTRAHTAIENEFKKLSYRFALVEQSFFMNTLRLDCVYDDYENKTAQLYEIKPITYCKQFNPYFYDIANRQLELYKLLYKPEYTSKAKGTAWKENFKILDVDNGIYNPPTKIVVFTFYDDFSRFDYQPGLIYYMPLKNKNKNIKFDPVHQTVTINQSQYVTIAENVALGLAIVAVAGGFALITISTAGSAAFVTEAVAPASIPTVLRLFEEASLRFAY
jgi:hypothetical protein